MMPLASYLDATLLEEMASAAQVEEFAEAAALQGCASVCIFPAHIAFARKAKIPIATVISFPHGADTAHMKAEATRAAIDEGADEIDMVMRIDALLAGEETVAYEDLRAVVVAAEGRVVKAIMETGALTPQAFEVASRVIINAGADYAKTCTGRGPRGVTLEDVLLLRRLLPPTVSIKAAGGIRDHEFAQQLINAGATRLGVSNIAAVLDN
jgi:deoxyribose-phosphate aldolase